VNVDLEKDQLEIIYDPKQLTPEKMLATVVAEGFEGKIVRGPEKALPGETTP
jgi:hypothetical protein